MEAPGCSGRILQATYYKTGCVISPAAATEVNLRFRSACNATHYEFTTICNVDCSNCQQHAINIAHFGCDEYNSFNTCGDQIPLQLACQDAAYTSPLELAAWIAGGNELDNSDTVSPAKNCLAVAADGTINGGWVVAYEGQQVRL